MSHIPQDAGLVLLGKQRETSIYQLKSVGLQNKYYVVSGEGTRHLMASPEVVGFESYLSMKPATSAALEYFCQNGLATEANILTILRGGLNYPLDECCYKAGIRVPDMDLCAKNGRAFQPASLPAAIRCGSASRRSWTVSAGAAAA